ncbi:MAG: alanine dehydrogenase [Dehalococcoidia bacterium]
MRVGTVRERKDGELRVGLTPEGAHSLVDRGHDVLVESGAGAGSGHTDADYASAGAQVVYDAETVWGTCDLVVKVKEPVASEYNYLRRECALFTYLHLAADRALTEALLDRRVTAIAYELVTRPDGSLPLLAPMSQVAGRMAAEVGAQLLKHPGPGRGKLLGGIAGVPPGKAVILGSGTVATAAARVLMGLEARTTVMSRDLARLHWLQEHFGGRIATRTSSPHSIAQELRDADLLITAVLVPGAAAPKIITREMVREMGDGAVIVDVSIDQGGAVETSRPTTHSAPTFVEEGVVHYCVTNMPGAVPHTSTLALTSATLPFVELLADAGVEEALKRDRALALGLSTYDGQPMTKAVGEALGIETSANPFVPSGAPGGG